jgi:5'-methylthioadenosine phosphorylase
MSVLPEAKLAREAELPYQMICMSTDYDAWKESEEAVSVEAVIANLTGNADFAKILLTACVPVIVERLSSGALKCVKELKGSSVHSCMTSGPKKGLEQIKKMQYMLPDMN